MACEIVMPQLGLTMTEGSVNAWVKQPGERVEKGEMLFTVSTDKVDMEVESTGSGFLNTLVDLGMTVPVGTVIAVLTDEPGEKVVATTKAAENGQVTASDSRDREMTRPEKTALRAGSSERRSFPASPRARNVAKLLGVEIADVVPESGTRIVEADVKRYHEARKSAPKPEPVSAARRITAERTTQSFERAPHFYLGREVNAGRMVQLRQELQGTAQKKLGFHITYTDFLLRALALALIEESVVNACWQDGGVVERQSIDVAFAAQTEKGLLAPVIANADKLDLFETAARRKELSGRAQQGKLQVEELQGGSATLSNLGMHGVDWFQAILNPPQSVILASGGIAKRPMVIDRSIQVAETLILTLSADHRVLDGVAAAKFLGAIARMVENPLELLV
jgi:pyruvate dehydrogenase E2 component (dihydrolipoyllysine-residue acetyltransferase)